MKLFGQDIGQEMPKAFLTDNLIWDNYISDIWLSILKFCAVKKTDSVLEIAPGTSTKIGGALAKLDFSGTLYVIDALPEVIKILKPQYEKLLPKAEIIWLSIPIFNAIKKLPKQIDHVFGNHILDDMLIYGSEHKDALKWSSAYTNLPSTDLQKSWCKISKDLEILQESKLGVKDDIRYLIRNVNPSSVVFNQYPSATLNDNNMASLNDEAENILLMIKEMLKEMLKETKQSEVQDILNSHPHYNNQHIGRHVLNARYWMICKKL